MPPPRTEMTLIPQPHDMRKNAAKETSCGKETAVEPARGSSVLLCILIKHMCMWVGAWELSHGLRSNLFQEKSLKAEASITLWYSHLCHFEKEASALSKDSGECICSSLKMLYIRERSRRGTWNGTVHWMEAFTQLHALSPASLYSEVMERAFMVRDSPAQVRNMGHSSHLQTTTESSNPWTGYFLYLGKIFMYNQCWEQNPWTLVLNLCLLQNIKNKMKQLPLQKD